MTIKATDIDSRKAVDSWIRTAIEYALISWTAHYNRMGKASPYVRMEKIIIGKVAEDSVLALLSEKSIACDTLGSTEWYRIDQYDVAIQGHAIDIKSNFIDLNNNYFIKRIPSILEDKLRWILKFQALVPLDQLNAAKRKLKIKNKLYIFSYLEGLFSGGGKSTVAHAFWDYRWLKKGDFKNSPSVGQLQISYSGTGKKFITIYGTTEKNVAKIEKIELGKQVKSKTSFHQVFSLKFEPGFPDNDLIIYSKSNDLKEIIKPVKAFSVEKDGKTILRVDNHWSEIWLKDCVVHTAGFIDVDDFKLAGEVFPRFTKTIEQYQETKVDNLGCKVTELSPITNLKTVK